MPTPLTQKIETVKKSANDYLTGAKLCKPKEKEKARILEELGIMKAEIEERLHVTKRSIDFAVFIETIRLEMQKKGIVRLITAVGKTRVFKEEIPLAEPILKNEPKAQEPRAQVRASPPEKAWEISPDYEIWRPIAEEGGFGKIKEDEEEPFIGPRRGNIAAYGPQMARLWDLSIELEKIERKIELETDKKKLPELLLRHKKILLEMQRARALTRPVQRERVEESRDNGFDNQWEGFVPPERLTAPSQWNASIVDARWSEHFELLKTATLIREWQTKK